MTIWTVEDVLALRPCEDYDRERLTNLWDGRDALAIADVCDLDIPAEDRLWLLCKAPFASIEPAITAIVTRALEPHETRTWAENWLSGEDRTSDAAYAYDAAYAAAAAAYDAAYAAAYDAAYAAAEAAEAAAAAAYAAAYAAAAAEAAASERELQIENFRALSLASRIRRDL